MSARDGSGGHPGRRLRILLLADGSAGHAGTLLEHVAAIADLSRHEVHVLNPRGIDSLRTLRLEEYDAVVIHYSLMIISDHYLSPWFREQIAAFSGLKAQFIQDDYRHVEAMRRTMRELGIRLLFTLVPEREIESVWPSAELPGMRKVTTLAGYVPSAAAAVRTEKTAARPLDVGYRGRALPPWLGILGQEKTWIAEGFLARASAHGLRCDISWTENARIYGADWLRFVASCRVTLGTESGSTITDFDDSIEREARRYLVEHPDAGFWDVHRAVLAPFEGNVMMNVISPRLFEAASLRTGLVLFPGEYSGILEPGRHYIPLEKDFSNMDEVVAAIRDVPALEEMIERTWTEIVASGRYSYARMVEELDRHLDELAEPGRRVRSDARVSLARTEERLLRARARPKHVLGTASRVAAGARLVAADAPTRRLLGRYARSRSLQQLVPHDALWYDLVRLAMIRRANAGRLTAGPDFVVEETHGEGARAFVSRPFLAPAGDAAPSPVAIEPADSGSVIWRHDAIAETFTVPLSPYRWVALPVVPRGGTPKYEFGTIRALRAHAPALVDDAMTGLATIERTRRLAPAEVPRRLPPWLIALRHPVASTRKVRLTLALLRSDPALRTAFLQTLGSSRLRDGISPKALVADFIFLDLLQRAGNGELAGIGHVEAECLADGTLHFHSLAQQPHHSASLAEALRDAPPVRRVVWDNSEVGIVVELEHDGHPVRFGLLPDGVREFPALAALLERDPSFALRTIASCLGLPPGTFESNGAPPR